MIAIHLRFKRHTHTICWCGCAYVDYTNHYFSSNHPIHSYFSKLYDWVDNNT